MMAALVLFHDILNSGPLSDKSTATSLHDEARSASLREFGEMGLQLLHRPGMTDKSGKTDPVTCQPLSFSGR